MKKEFKKENLSKQAGFGLVEVIVVASILAFLTFSIGVFGKDIFSINSFVQFGLTNQNEGRKILRPFVSEVRSASQSSLGSYPIATAATSTFTFYTDTDSDGIKERIRYFLDDDELKKGIIIPEGNPLTYDDGSEDVENVIHHVVSTSTIFRYYDESYDGTASSTPLDFPVLVSDIRLVEIIVSIDSDPNRPPEPSTVNTKVSIRNLKNNL